MSILHKNKSQRSMQNFHSPQVDDKKHKEGSRKFLSPKVCNVINGQPASKEEKK